MTSPAGPGRVVGNTLVVILVLVGVFCVLPVLAFCLFPALFGAIVNP